MPFTLDCICVGEGLLCEVSSIKFVVTSYKFNKNLIPIFELIGGPDIQPSISVVEAGPYTLDPGWMASVMDDSAYVRMVVATSLNSDEIRMYSAFFHIEINYHCSDGHGRESEQRLKLLNGDLDVAQCYFEPSHTFIARGELTVGSISGVLAHSGSLATDCPSLVAVGSSGQGFAVQGGHWGKKPAADVEIVDADSGNGQTCLCATGGSEPYMFSLWDGWLPGGVSLNAITGCFDGEPDGTRAGSERITVMAMDSAGQLATVECQYLFCPKGPGRRINRMY